MTRLATILIVVSWSTLPLAGNPSNHFSTVPSAELAWQLSPAGVNELLFFPLRRAQINPRNPEDVSLFINCMIPPAVTVTDLQEREVRSVDTLLPAGPFMIVRYTRERDAMAASAAARQSLCFEDNCLAYSNPLDDLHLTDGVPGYSPEVGEMVAPPVGESLFHIILSGNELDWRTSTGLKGQTAVVPIPATLLLASLGALTAGYVRWRTLL